MTDLERDVDRAVERARDEALDAQQAAPDCPVCGGELRVTEDRGVWACGECREYVVFAAPDEDNPQGSWKFWALEDE